MTFQNSPLAGAIVAALCCVAPPAAAASPAGAEYALRWNARDGGPKTGEEALAALHIRVPRPGAFTVDYYDLPAATPTPPGFSAILRRRVDGAGAAELTWKLRGDRPLPAWTCPLRNASTSKAEVDVTLGESDSVARSYSYSCTTEDADAAVSQLSATRKACSAAMKRWTRRGLKVEEWRLPGNVRLVEVSRTGADTKADLDRFRRKVAGPLLAAGVVPAASSKTELGSHCE